MTTSLLETRKKVGVREIAQDLRKKISRGDLAIGSTIPSVRELSGKYLTSHQTAQNAIRIIEAEGLIECRNKKPAVVLAGNSEDKTKISNNNIIRQIGVVEGAFFENPVNTHYSAWGYNVTVGIKKALSDKKIEIVIIPFEKSTDFYEQLTNRDIAGYLFFGKSSYADLHKFLSKKNKPWVCLLGVGAEDEHNVVHANNYAGGVKVGKVFVRLGFKKVLILGAGFQQSVSSVQKSTGIFNAYIGSKTGVEGLKIVDSGGGIDESDGYECTKRFIDENGKPDGIFALGDWLAKGACVACGEYGFEVGKDVGIVGATGLDCSVHFNPSLSVLKQPMKEMGQVVADMLCDMIKTGNAVIPSRGCPSEFIIRDSLYIPEEAGDDIEKILSDNNFKNCL